MASLCSQYVHNTALKKIQWQIRACTVAWILKIATFAEGRRIWLDLEKNELGRHMSLFWQTHALGCIILNLAEAWAWEEYELILADAWAREYDLVLAEARAGRRLSWFWQTHDLVLAEARAWDQYQLVLEEVYCKLRSTSLCWQKHELGRSTVLASSEYELILQ